MRKHLDARLRKCKLELHPEKTRVVYCKDSKRIGTHEHIEFDFLGYTFRPRQIVGYDGKPSTGFTPALSRTSMKAMRQSTRRRRLHLRSEWSVSDLAHALNPRVRGWIQYYCRFRGSEFQSVARHLDDVVVRWAMRKYKSLRSRKLRAYSWLDALRLKQPNLFAHWRGQGSFKVGTMGAQ